jgi:diketogulonate reductase-like aldo/keto reductase
VDRREALQFLSGLAAAAAFPRAASAQASKSSRAIPSSGESIPAIGLGTWITFDVTDPTARQKRGEILRAFLAAGGRTVDSSPMYGASEATLGTELAKGVPGELFAATKVWTVGQLAGRRQVEQSRRLWNVARFDLLQVHNMLDWEVHLPTLKDMKAQGRVRYIGITTSHGRRHDLVEKILKEEKLDFLQITYNIDDPQVEQRVLPLAADRGVAVIINRPFDGGEMFGARTRKPLPGWAREIGCQSWAQAFLKWVVSHPAVTCAIPATSQLAHLQENMRALAGPFPDEALRRRIAADYLG